MSANFFKINRGINLDPQTSYGSGDPVGNDGDIYYNDVLGKFRKHENGSWTDLGGGSVNNGRSGNAAISSGLQQVTVVFSSPLPTANYVVIAEMENDVDANPQFQQVTVTNKTVNGFTAKWNADTDSANYTLSYIVPGSTVVQAEWAVPIGSTSIVVPISVPFPDSQYAVIALLQDVTDPTPQFQPVIVTQKSSFIFTVKWNAPTDSSNYVIAYQAVAYV
jgi:hypothetical protein